MRRSRNAWLGAWTALSRAATKSTLKSQKKLGRKVSKAIGTAAGKAHAHGTAQWRTVAQRAMTGVMTPANRASAQSGGAWQQGHWGMGPLALRSYRLFIPSAVISDTPDLVVLLHGCGQDAASFAASTRAASIARAEGCLLLMPEQSVQANRQRCWNWFRSDVRTAGEASVVMAIIERIASEHRVGNIYLIGMSAGGSMAMTLALGWPERFAAVVSHSGAAPHSAHNAVQATHAMRGQRGPDTDALRGALSDRALPPLMLIHGDVDHTVVADNALASAALWLQLIPHAHSHAVPVPERARTAQRGARRSLTLSDWKIAGKLYVRLATVAGLGHAWSGGAASQAYSDPSGPDALRLALRFFRDCRAGTVKPGAILAKQPGKAAARNR